MRNFLNLKNNIFYNNEKAKDFLVEKNILSSTKHCICGNNMLLKIRVRENAENLIYQCTNSTCRRILSAFKNTIFFNTKLEISKIFLLLNLFLNNVHNFAVENLTDVTEKSFIEFKKK